MWDLCFYSIFTVILNVQFPDEQFFHTDYRPLIWDREHNVLDEEVCVCVCVFVFVCVCLHVHVCMCT